MKQKIDFDKAEFNQIKQNYTLEKQLSLKKIQEEKKNSEVAAEHDRDAELAKIEADAATERERALLAEEMAANHRAEALKIEEAVKKAVENALEEQNKIREQQAEEARKLEEAERKKI